MPRTSHQFVVSRPIPSSLPLDHVLAALHSHVDIMNLQAFTTGYRPISLEHAKGADDPFFADGTYDGGRIKAYEVTEAITIVPGIGDIGKKTIALTSLFQNQQDGVKAVGFAPAAVVVRGYFKIEKSPENDGGGFNLTERVSAECSSILMPFVRPSMVEAHESIVRDLLVKLDRESDGHQLQQEGCAEESGS